MWMDIGVAVLLVLLGGSFAGLTIAFMGQDETYLQVLRLSSEDATDKKDAARVLRLLQKGKHWVLVTLLLSNTITNETLPIMLDRSIGGGWPAVLSSTALIVIFGEIVPQSVCVRYGLSIGARMAPFVLALMWILSPVAWPTAKLLDWAIGQDHGVVYKKAGLKTLVNLHRTIGTGGERLMEDEVNIINSVLDLKDKAVGDVMTPMEDVFTMSADTILDGQMMHTILSQGYSRIPVHAPDNKTSFIGMLLVKTLITYDPRDCQRVREFTLATLPETTPDTSCLDIINYFQEGKSHMVLVSDAPGTDHGALGVVTLEDVIEELIGEEIIDESDVFIDVHKAIRRLAPADQRRFKMSAGQLVEDHMSEIEREELVDSETAPLLLNGESRIPSITNGRTVSPSQPVPGTTFLMRRKSSNASDSAIGDVTTALKMRSNVDDIREHLKHLGPSNAASKPKPTRYTSVKIKPGVGTIPENRATTVGADARPRSSDTRASSEQKTEISALLTKKNGASDGVAALQAGYGTGDDVPGRARGLSESDQMTPQEASKLAREYTTSPPAASLPPRADHASRSNDFLKVPPKTKTRSEVEEEDQVGEMETPSRDRSKSRRMARSGSITETTVDVGGMKKVVLETNTSSEDDVSPTGQSGSGLTFGEDGTASSRPSSRAGDPSGHDGEGEGGQHGDGKKKRRKNRKKKHGGGGGSDR